MNRFIKTGTCFILFFLLHCGKKTNDPCIAEWDCMDCTCLFEKLQQNLHDPQTAKKIQECYDKACK